MRADTPIHRTLAPIQRSGLGSAHARTDTQEQHSENDVRIRGTESSQPASGVELKRTGGTFRKHRRGFEQTGPQQSILTSDKWKVPCLARQAVGGICM